MKFRDLDLSRIKSNGNDAIVRMSTSDPVLQSGGYWEVLNHNQGAINLQRVRGGAVKVLLNHDTKQAVGAVRDVWVENGCAYCRFEWSNSELGNQIKREYADGILDKVSVGYRPNPQKCQDLRGEDGRTLRLINEWELLELSLVTVPVDPRATKIRSLSLSVNTMPTTNTRFRDEINSLERQFGLPSDFVDELYESGQTLTECKRSIASFVRGRDSNVNAISQLAGPLGLSYEEQSKYSLTNVYRALDAKKLGQFTTRIKDSIGYEQEISNHIAKECGCPIGENSFYIPARDLIVPFQRAPYGVGSAAIGGATVQTEVKGQNLIEFLSNTAMCFRLGVQMLPGLQGNQQIPRQSGTAQTYFIGENASAITESEATFDSINLTPKIIGAYSITGPLIRVQSTIDIESFTRLELMKRIALGVDQAMINGVGSSTTIQGIIGYSGVSSVSVGPNGGAPTYDHMIQLQAALGSANAFNFDTVAYLQNWKTRSKLQLIAALGNTMGLSIFTPSPNPAEASWLGTIAGIKAGVSNQVPSNLTKGTGTNLSALIFGNWADAVFGTWNVVEIMVDPYSLAPTLQTRYVANLIADFNLRHAASFAVMTDIATT